MVQKNTKLLQKLGCLDSYLLENIKGQEHVIKRLTSVLKRGELGICHSGRPKGSFLFVGPTGVGKTEVTRCFTDYLFGPGHLIRFDMSEFMLTSSIGRLIGEKEGEVGLFGKKLTEVPYGTLLFDEMEKAEPRILDLFLQILDTGSITLADNNKRYVNNYYIVFTSNIGAYEVANMVRSPFSTIERVVLSQVNEVLRPELIGRINEKIVFNKLNFKTQVGICKHLLCIELERLRRLGFLLRIDDRVIDFLMNVGFHKTLGARPLRGVIEKHLGDVVAHQILNGLPTSGILKVNSLRTELILEADVIAL